MKKKKNPSNYGAPFLVTTRPTFPDDGSQLRTSFVLQHIAKARCSCPSFNGFRQPTRNMQLHPPGKPATWSTVQRRPARAALSSPSSPVLTARNKVNSNNQLSQTVGSETDLTGDGDTELTQPPSLKQPRRNDTSGGNEMAHNFLGGEETRFHFVDFCDLFVASAEKTEKKRRMAS